MIDIVNMNIVDINIVNGRVTTMGMVATRLWVWSHGDYGYGRVATMGEHKFLNKV